MLFLEYVLAIGIGDFQPPLFAHLAFVECKYVGSTGMETNIS